MSPLAFMATIGGSSAMDKAYDLKDDFSERPEFRQLKEELRTGIRTWIDENGVPGYRSPARKEKPPVPYSEQPRYPKRNKRK